MVDHPARNMHRQHRDGADLGENHVPGGASTRPPPSTQGSGRRPRPARWSAARLPRGPLALGADQGTAAQAQPGDKLKRAQRVRRAPFATVIRTPADR